MGFLKRDHRSGPEGDDIDVHVMCEIFRIDKASGGPGPFRYLLYKDVNRHPKLRPGA